MDRSRLAVADVSDNEEGSYPDSPADRSLLRKVRAKLRGGAKDSLSAPGVQRVDMLMLADLIMAILDSRASFPLAASAALIRARDGQDEVIHLVLLDEEREPLFVRAGTMAAVTYAARRLDNDILAAFGDREVIVLK
jgi:hypothetical protein